MDRLEADPVREDLLLRTLRAAEESAYGEKLVLLAMSLAAGARVNDERDVQWEAVFVQALADLGTIHVDTPRCFTRTPNELGLADGYGEFDEPSHVLNSLHLVTALPRLDPVLDATLSTLERHGLVRETSGSGTALIDGPRPPLHIWQITPFGRSFTDRLMVVGQAISGAADASRGL